MEAFLNAFRVLSAASSHAFDARSNAFWVFLPAFRPAMDLKNPFCFFFIFLSSSSPARFFPLPLPSSPLPPVFPIFPIFPIFPVFVPPPPSPSLLSPPVVFLRVTWPSSIVVTVGTTSTDLAQYSDTSVKDHVSSLAVTTHWVADHANNLCHECFTIYSPIPICLTVH